MEIAQSKDRQIGFSGSAGTTFEVDGETVPLMFGAGGLGADLTGIADVLSKGGGGVGLIGPEVDIPAGGLDGGTVSVPLIGFALKALQTTTNVNVLSTPHILTLENEEAEIQVGKRRPYSTLGVGSGLGGLSSLLGGFGRHERAPTPTTCSAAWVGSVAWVASAARPACSTSTSTSR
jgi:general secretion pathway protein D